ncbi:MAG: TonB-dependent siderophore receptor [Rhizobacter sp.]|nr:TonB-dependent siderophore receptor [Rhizobacter sp.]
MENQVKNRPKTLVPGAVALACLVTLADARAQAQQAPVPPAAEAASAPQGMTLDKVVVTAKRERRVSKGATNLPLEIKDTPQTISTIDGETLHDFGATSSNAALQFGTGLVVDEWETNRTSFQARGFDVMLTQVDGLGMTNDWGLVESQKDAYLFDHIDLVRGANGLLTGVGNASGTINYIRKRPTNRDGGEVIVRAGSHDFKRLALDYNKVFSADGAWAGRLVVAHEDKGSYLRALHDRRSTLYGIVDGQVGDEGVLTVGFTAQDARQRSPMWGSLTLPRADGSQAEFDVSASTAQDWTRWNNRSLDGFVEYTHALSSDWEGKLTYNHREGKDSTKLFYAYTLTGTLNDDNTGLIGWPYRSQGESSADVVDANLSGRFGAFGRRHEVIVGVSHSKQKKYAESYAITSPAGPALPAFPYAGDVYPEPTWGDTTVAADGRQTLTRLYGATRLALTDRLKGIVGFNAIRLERDGTSIYGGGVNLDDETTRKVSPYVGATFDITPDLLAYASYSDIFQAQDQRDANGAFLAPMKGLNAEVGVKAEWLDRKLLTTFAVFSAEQKGLATEAGFDPVAQQSWYEPRDVTSRGFELEASGHLDDDTRLSVGYTQLKLTGPDGGDIYEWVPRRALKFLVNSRVSFMPRLRLGLAARWQSDVAKIGGARQGDYLLANAFAAYALTDAATVRLGVDNLFDEKYLRTVQFGAIYGAPRTVSLSLEYKL